MSRKRRLGTKQKIALMTGAATLAGGFAAATMASGHASVVCDGLDQAIRNNQAFIAGQRANPDAQSAARIANREAVIQQINVQRQASGCGAAPGAPAAAAPAGQNQGQNAAQPPAAPPAGAVNGQVVCPGSTVTLSGEAGAPAASSNQFPMGTRLKVTNLDNGTSTTVAVTSTSGSCVLLNNAAFEQVREPGKFLIRKARIERVG
ncbi:hypothetical protein [Streptomyces sp. MI02-7b]|uniref:hypothetical protein n=1 Tax=Streptomyces sp. MI02-7b TaxID=462941 RepID=UPI0029A055C5|nr:hypothetical protein [Streptomyces sp. MI02-7b]MDX3075354.1 hypothetical protein [Streptomyces sp. MI02-7b]